MANFRPPCRYCTLTTHYSGMCNKTPSKVYALKCEEDKWYIGQTKNIDERINNHKRGEGFGSIWTTKYKPIEIVEVIECDFKDRLIKENELTLKYIQEYGFDNVAGGKYISERCRQSYKKTQTL